MDCLKLSFIFQNYGHALILQKKLKNIVKLPIFHQLPFTIQSQAQYFNSSIFAIKKKNQASGGIHKGYYKIVVDLKDCFFTIPLHPQDCERFAFSVLSINFKEPMKRYQWIVLSQGMANSPILCQKFVAQAIQPNRQQ